MISNGKENIDINIQQGKPKMSLNSRRKILKAEKITVGSSGLVKTPSSRSQPKNSRKTLKRHIAP
jgi:hypothetical protein